MVTQMDRFGTETFGIVPSALVVVMTILALLGIIANVAMA
jgi:hypothetical protein